MRTFLARFVSFILALNMICPLGLLSKAHAGDHSAYQYAGGVDGPKSYFDESGCKAKLSDQDLAELYVQRQKIHEAMSGTSGGDGKAPQLGALDNLNNSNTSLALRENRIAFATIMKVGGCNEAKFQEKIDKNPRTFDVYLNTIQKTEKGNTQLDDDDKHAMSWFEQTATEIGCNKEKLRMAAVAYAVIGQSEEQKEASRLKYKIWKSAKEGKPVKVEDLNYKDQKALETLNGEMTDYLKSVDIRSFLNADETKTFDSLRQKVSSEDITVKEQRQAQNDLAKLVKEKQDMVVKGYLEHPQDRLDFIKSTIDDNYAASYAELEKNEVVMQLDPDPNPKAAQPGDWSFSYNNYKDKFKNPKFEAAFHRVFGNLSDEEIAKTHEKSGFTPADPKSLYIHTFQRYWERDKAFDDAHTPGKYSEEADAAYAVRDENLNFVAADGQGFSLRPPQTWNGQKNVVRVESQEWMEKRIMEAFKRFDEGVTAYHETLGETTWVDAKNQLIVYKTKLDAADSEMRAAYKQLSELKIPAEQLNALAKIQGDLAHKSGETAQEAYRGYRNAFIVTSALSLLGPLALVGEAGVGAGAGVYAGIARAGALARSLMVSFGTGVAMTTGGQAIGAIGDVKAGNGNYWCNLSRSVEKSLPSTLVTNMAYAPLGPIMGKIGAVAKLRAGATLAKMGAGPKMIAWLGRPGVIRAGMSIASHAPTTGLALTGGKFMFGEEKADEGVVKSGLRKVFGQESVLHGLSEGREMDKQSDELKAAAEKQQDEALKMLASGDVEQQRRGREALMQSQEMAKQSEVLNGKKYEAFGSSLVGLTPLTYGLLQHGIRVPQKEVYLAQSKAVVESAGPTLKAQGISIKDPVVRSAVENAIADHLASRGQTAFDPKAPEFANFAESVARNKIESIAMAKNVRAGSVTQEPLAHNAPTATRQMKEYQEGVQALEHNLDIDMLRQNAEAQKKPVSTRQEWEGVDLQKDPNQLSELQGMVISGLSEIEVPGKSFTTSTTKKTEIVSGQVENIEVQTDKQSGKPTKVIAKVRVAGKGGGGELRDVVLLESDQNGQPKKGHVYKVKEPTPLTPDELRVVSRNRTGIDKTNMGEPDERSRLNKAVAKMNPDPHEAFAEAAAKDINPKDPKTGERKYTDEQVAAARAHVLEELRQYGPTNVSPTDNLKMEKLDMISTTAFYFSVPTAVAFKALLVGKTMLGRSATAETAVKGSFLEATMKHYLEHPTEMNPSKPREVNITTKANIEALVKAVTKESFADDTFSQKYTANGKGVTKLLGNLTKGVSRKLFGNDVPEAVQRAVEDRLELIYKRTGMTPELGSDKAENTMWKKTTEQIIAQETARYKTNSRAAAQMVKAGKVPALNGLEPATLTRYQENFVKELQGTGEQVDPNIADHQKRFAEFVQAEIKRDAQAKANAQDSKLIMTATKNTLASRGHLNAEATASGKLDLQPALQKAVLDAYAKGDGFLVDSSNKIIENRSSPEKIQEQIKVLKDAGMKRVDWMDAVLGLEPGTTLETSFKPIEEALPPIKTKGAKEAVVAERLKADYGTLEENTQKAKDELGKAGIKVEKAQLKNWQQAIWDAHIEGHDVAGRGYVRDPLTGEPKVTESLLRDKARILKDAGIPENVRRVLIEKNVVGLEPEHLGKSPAERGPAEKAGTLLTPESKNISGPDARLPTKLPPEALTAEAEHLPGATKTSAGTPEAVAVENLTANVQKNPILTKDFGGQKYIEVTNKMRGQVDTWIDEAKAASEKAPDNMQLKNRVAVLEKHRGHLRAMEGNLNRKAQQLRAEGYNVERIRSDIWTHDIGKFVPPADFIIERQAFRKTMLGLASSDPKVHDPVAKIFADQGIGAAEANEILAMGKDFQGSPKTLIAKITKAHPNFAKVMQSPASRNFFGEFMDHAETSRAWIRENFTKLGFDRELGQQLAIDSIGHDGPGVKGVGVFWGDNYGPQTGKNYPTSPVTREGNGLEAFDRLDQSQLSIGADGGLAGGPPKITQERINGGMPFQVALIKDGLGTVPEGTRTQGEALRVVNGASDQPMDGVTRSPAANGRVPANMDRDIKEATGEVIGLREATKVFDRPDAQGNVGTVKVNGTEVPFKDMNSYWGPEGAATKWYKDRHPGSVAADPNSFESKRARVENRTFPAGYTMTKMAALSVGERGQLANEQLDRPHTDLAGINKLTLATEKAHQVGIEYPMTLNKDGRLTTNYPPEKAQAIVNEKVRILMQEGGVSEVEAKRILDKGIAGSVVAPTNVPQKGYFASGGEMRSWELDELKSEGWHKPKKWIGISPFNPKATIPAAREGLTRFTENPNAEAWIHSWDNPGGGLGDKYTHALIYGDTKTHGANGDYLEVNLVGPGYAPDVQISGRVTTTDGYKEFNFKVKNSPVTNPTDYQASIVGMAQKLYRASSDATTKHVPTVDPLLAKQLLQKILQAPELQ